MGKGQAEAEDERGAGANSGSSLFPSPRTSYDHTAPVFPRPRNFFS